MVRSRSGIATAKPARTRREPAAGRTFCGWCCSTSCPRDFGARATLACSIPTAGTASGWCCCAWGCGPGRHRRRATGGQHAHGCGVGARPKYRHWHQTKLAMRVQAATKPPASDNLTYPGVSAGQTFGRCFLYRPPTIWPGLVQQPDQIAASRDLSFFVGRHRRHHTTVLVLVGRGQTRRARKPAITLTTKAAKPSIAGLPRR